MILSCLKSYYIIFQTLVQGNQSKSGMGQEKYCESWTVVTKSRKEWKGGLSVEGEGANKEECRVRNFPN